MVNHPKKRKLQRRLKDTSGVTESTQCMAERLTLHDEIWERVVGLVPAPIAVRILEVLRNERAPVQIARAMNAPFGETIGL